MIWLALCLIQGPLTDLRQSFSPYQKFEARFSQEVRKPPLKVEQPPASSPVVKASGILRFERPRQMTWIYETPEPRTLRYEGRKIIIEEDGQKEELKSQSPVTMEEVFSFLWGRADLKHFKMQEKGKDRIYLTPLKSDWANFESMEVRLEKGRVAEVKLKTLGDSTTSIQFSDWKYLK